MKSKILRIMGVGLTLAMVLSLTVVIAVPAAAGENDWTSPAKPAKEGAPGDYFYDSTIVLGPGPMAMAIDGTLYVYADPGGVDHILKSTDGGRSWDTTDYSVDIVPAGGPVVDMVCSSLDADILYATDGLQVFWTANGGGKWETVADASLQAALTGTDFITCIDVTYSEDEDPYVFAGTVDVGYTGNVYYVNQAGYPTNWTALNVDDGAANPTVDVYAVAALPNFADSGEIVALITDATYTGVVSNTNGAIGDWTELDPLVDELGAAIESIWASRICFPDDFSDDDYEMFVGITGLALDTGSVYRVGASNAYCLGKDDGDIERDVVSLDLVGGYGNTTLIAGTTGTVSGTDNKVIVSTNDGDDWDDASKEPSGLGWAYVVMDPDFADNGTAWAACDGLEGAVSLTIDEGAVWNQISMIATDIMDVDSVSFSRNYLTDETMFLLTSDTATGNDSLWRNDGSNWERVFVSTLTTPGLGVIDEVQVSPAFPSDEAVYVADLAGILYRSTDAGNKWKALSNQPTVAFTAWLVVNTDIVLTASAANVDYTTNHGRRAWESEAVAGLGVPSAFGMSPNFGADDTLLLADAASAIFISEDIGESWDQVGGALAAVAVTIPTFDVAYGTNGTIYAASGGEVDRCVIDTDDAWGDQTWKQLPVTETLPLAGVPAAMGAASGLVCSADGTLYAADGTPALATAIGVAATGGVWRCLNPTADLGDVVFELVGADADFGLAAGATINGLRLTAGSNILWVEDATTTDLLWQYEDTMATEVALNEPWSNVGIDDTNKAWLSWNELTGADEYDLKYTTDEAFRVGVVTLAALDDTEERIGDGAPGVDIALSDGTSYYWKVKATEPLLSRWSKEWTFTTALDDVAVPITWEPANGAQGVILQPSFGWTAVGSATSYELELADNPGFTGATKATTTINSWVSDTDLSYNTTYYWRVKALKDSVVVSDWVSGAFVTMSKPAAAVEVTPAPPAPQITIPAPQVIIPAAVTPMWVWAIIGIGAALVIAVIVLIVRTRRAL